MVMISSSMMGFGGFLEADLNLSIAIFDSFDNTIKRALIFTLILHKQIYLIYLYIVLRSLKRFEILLGSHIVALFGRAKNWVGHERVTGFLS